MMILIYFLVSGKTQYRIMARRTTRRHGACSKVLMARIFFCVRWTDAALHKRAIIVVPTVRLLSVSRSASMDGS